VDNLKIYFQDTVGANLSPDTRMMRHMRKKVV